jgi:esterase/lipase superfamily enzyme
MIIKLMLFILIIFQVFGCAGHEKIESKKITEISGEIQVPVVEEPINLDLELQDKLQGIWKQYFVEDFNDTRAVNVMVFTNRQMKGKGFGCTDDNFGIGLDTNIKVGVCRVNVPRNHSTGELNFTKDQRQSSRDFFKIIGQKELSIPILMDYLKKSKRSPLIFVHGFNVKYEEAVLRASQIAYDLKYQGPILLFSWPAGAGDSFLDEKLINRTYAANLKSAQASVLAFKVLISSLIENKIIPNIVVHSMGHQVVLPALFELGKDGLIPLDNKRLPLGEIILTAPDFDADLFVKNIEVIKNLSRRVTLYCSYNDKAMFASETMNSNKRLGGCTYMEGVDSINVSLLDNSTFGLNHGYYSSRPILADVFQVLLGIDAGRRLFMRKSEPNSTEKFYLRQ